MDPIAFREANVIPDDAYPATGASGIKLEILSHEACLREAKRVCDYDMLRAEQATLRKQNVYRGIGVATLIELTNPSAAFYGVGGARIASQDGATLRLEPTGVLTVSSSVGEQGQGAEAVFDPVGGDAFAVAGQHLQQREDHVLLADLDRLIGIADAVVRRRAG